MRELIGWLIIVFCSISCLGQKNVQKSLFSKNINWNKYEKLVSTTYKAKEINKIKDDLLIYLKDNKILKDNLQNFHFIDYNSNGIIDIIYSGYGMTDSKQTIIFELGLDGMYYSNFNKFGEIINIYQSNICMPVSFVLRDIMCCGGNQIIYEVYSLILSKKESRLQLSAKYCSYRETEIPNELLDKAITFEVVNKKYFLRLSPNIDVSNKYNEDLHINGNIVQTYTTGSKGYAISQRIDSTGRIWWFVIMLNNLNLKDNSTVGDNNTIHHYSIGWMSSKYLIHIKL